MGAILVLASGSVLTTPTGSFRFYISAPAKETMERATVFFTP